MKEYVCITGGSTGIGRSLVEFFYDQNYHVIATVRSEADRLQLLKEKTDGIDILLCDVTNTVEVENAGQRIRQITGRRGLSVLINNAGIVVAGPLMYLERGELQKQFDVNVLGLVHFTQVCFDALKKCKDSKIINMGSVSGIITFPFTAAYAASKHAIEAISDGMRRELKPFGVQVVLLQPGAIKTPIWSKSKGVSKKYENTPYGPYLEKADQQVDQIEARSTPVEFLSKKVLRIALKKSPKDRYIIAPRPWIYKIMGYWTPTSWLDYLMTRKRLLSE